MKTYIGWRDGGGKLHVMVENDRGDYQLPVRLDLWNHSPDGFNAGYGGSGPAQLALAILADALEDGEQAVRLHQEFKWNTVAKWSQDEGFSITLGEVRAVVDALLVNRELERLVEE